MRLGSKKGNCDASSWEGGGVESSHAEAKEAGINAVCKAFTGHYYWPWTDMDRYFLFDFCAWFRLGLAVLSANHMNAPGGYRIAFLPFKVPRA